MQDLAENYIKELKENPDFIRLIDLKKQIDEKYASLIVSLKNKEAKYLEAKKYPMYYSNFNEIQNDFVLAKKNLYSKEEVKEYFSLERKIQQIIDEDFNEVKNSISNKFSLNKTINF